MTLILSIATGLVSPQFHLQYDDFFKDGATFSRKRTIFLAVATALRYQIQKKLDAEGAADPGTTVNHPIPRQKQVQGDTVQYQVPCPEPEVDNSPTPAEEGPD